MGSDRAEGLAAVESRATESRTRESGFRVRTRIVPVLRQGTREFRLERPLLTIGRSTTCDIHVLSGLVSRQHARVTLTPLGVSVEDLGSRNGVYLNSERIVESALMKTGDRLAIGDEVLVLGEIEEPVPEDSGTMPVSPAAYPRREAGVDDETGIVATRSADIFLSLSRAVDKALALGRGDEAEYLLGTHLEVALADVLAGRHLPADIARTAAGYAVKLAGATNKPGWLDHAVRLYRALELVLPLALVDEMYVLLRRVRGIDIEELGLYTTQLRDRAATLAPAERFVLQRLIGLERLAAWQRGSRL
ncbi:MAG TPA: FHA domain-containing protein [Polyangiaceae bacterium]